MLPKAVLFDFDYTLGDSTAPIVECFQYAFGQMGLPRPEPEVITPTIGHSLEDSYTLLTGDADPGRRALFKKTFRSHATHCMVRGTKLLPGAGALLDRLSACGVPAGIVTTKRAITIRQIFQYQRRLDQLAVIIGADSVPNGKPAPDGLFAAMAALNVSPADTLYCGDTVIDAEAASRAGVPFCAVLNGTTPRAAFEAWPCVCVAEDLFALRAFLQI